MALVYDGTLGLTYPDNSVQNTAATGFGFKNRIINGACVIDQRNNGASVSATDGGYQLDRWSTILNTGTFTVQRNAGSVTPPAGFTNYLGATVTSSGAVTGTTGIRYKVEGYNISDLAWGTANARPITMSFYVYSSLTGNFGGSIESSDQNLSYPYLYTVSTPNTWTYITVNVPGPTSGLFNTTNTGGIIIEFSFTTGVAQQGTPGVWQSGYRQGAVGQVQIMSTNGATFYITGFQFEKGSTATSFDYRPYGMELALCQRYYVKAIKGSYPGSFAAYAFSAASFTCSVQFPVTMRAIPTTVTFYYNGTANAVGNISTAGSVSITVSQNWWTADGILGANVSGGPLTIGMSYGFDYIANAEL